MINLTTNITFPNCNRWEVLAFDINTGRVTLRFWAPAGTLPQPLWQDRQVILSDVAGKSDQAVLNANPTTWDGKFSVLTAFGPVLTPALANALTHARDAYRASANHNAGLRAIEGTAMTDLWVSAAFAGT